MILLLKRGYLELDYFQNKFNADIVAQWRSVWDGYVEQGYVELGDDEVRLTREGLLRVDSLLSAFFEPEHQNVRYT
jgi:oxygen-independent coproporphyrinogen-3 oxidase